MKLKRKIAIIAVFAIIVTALIAGSAAAADGTRIFDEMDVLNETQLSALDDYARVISEECKMDVAILLTTGEYTANYSSLSDYALDCYYDRGGLGSNGFILALDDDNALWTVACSGYSVNVVTDAAMDDFFEAYNEETTYVDGIMAYLDETAAFLQSELTLYGDAIDGDLARTSDEPLPRFIDDMGLLTEQQAADLTARLNRISEAHQFDVVVAVVPALDSRVAHLYAADFFEQNGFGYGNSQDGAILLLATEDRDFGFAAQGFGNYAFTSVGQDYLDTHFIPHLKEDRYFDGFTAFADAVDDFLTQAEAGKPYDEGNIPMLASERNTMRIVFIVGSVLIGLISAAIVTGAWKRKLKSVRSASFAHEYIIKDSMRLSVQNDIFMHRHVSKTKRVESSSSSGGGSGGGSSFRSSSGSSSTGHSGKY